MLQSMESERVGYVCVSKNNKCITESLGCVAVSNNIVNQLYFK